MEQQSNHKTAQQQDELEEMRHGPVPVEQLQVSGIASIDVKKLKDAGLCTVEAVAYFPSKDRLQIKGISEAKVDKIIEAGMSFVFIYCIRFPTVLTCKSNHYLRLFDVSLLDFVFYFCNGRYRSWNRRPLNLFVIAIQRLTR